MLNGIFPPLTTPFEQGEVAGHRLRQNVRQLNTTGLAGYVVLGSNGEAVSLSREEKLRVIETVKEEIPPDRLLIAGTGQESTAATIALTREAAHRGADLALVITPSFFASAMTPRALLEHYTAVAEASPIPILLYNVPKFTGVNIPPETVAQLAQHPHIVGIKSSSENLGYLGEIIHRVDEKFAVLVGTASVLFPGLCLGASGGIVALANIAPRECVEIFRLTRAGKWEAAHRLQLQLIPVNRAVTAQFGISGLKAAMDMRGYFGGAPRPPLLPLDEAHRKTLEDILRSAGLLEATPHNPLGR